MKISLRDFGFFHVRCLINFNIDSAKLLEKNNDAKVSRESRLNKLKKIMCYSIRFIYIHVCKINTCSTLDTVTRINLSMIPDDPDQVHQKQ